MPPRASSSAAGRQLAALLLDQGFVAGLGNYLRAEILFEARIHPRLRAHDLSDEKRQRLADRVIALTKRTYRTRGITLSPSRVAELKAAGAPRSAYRFWFTTAPGRRAGSVGGG